jgi:hypothetical protein
VSKPQNIRERGKKKKEQKKMKRCRTATLTDQDELQKGALNVQ